MISSSMRLVNNWVLPGVALGLKQWSLVSPYQLRDYSVNYGTSTPGLSVSAIHHGFYDQG